MFSTKIRVIKDLKRYWLHTKLYKPIDQKETCPSYIKWKNINPPGQGIATETESIVRVEKELSKLYSNEGSLSTTKYELQTINKNVEEDNYTINI